MARHALVNKENLVVSVVNWPGGSFVCPRDHQSIESLVAKVGDTYDGKSFIAADGSIRK